MTVRSVLALRAAKGWNLFQMDVNNVFLKDDLYENVHMDIRQGYGATKSECGSSGRNVCSMVK